MRAKADKAQKPGREPAGTQPERNEFSRLVDVEAIPPQGLELSISAEAEECGALARRGDLVAVESLAADFHVTKANSTRVRVVGNLRARIVQTCVISLDPFEAEVTGPIEVDFSGPTIPFAATPKLRAELGGETGRASPPSVDMDAPDPIIDGKIDLGALAAEFLMLNLDPYPRKPGVVFEERGSGDAAGLVHSPFAALRKRE